MCVVFLLRWSEISGLSVAVVIALLGLIINYASAVAVAKYAVPEDPEVGMAEAVDFTGGKDIDWSKWLLFGGVGLLILFGLNDN